MKKRAIAPVVHKYQIGEQPREAEEWHLYSHQARLAVLEELRREYHLWKYDAEPRPQRVYRIVKQ